jgi:uroporphyrinogen-III decarboxylase
MATVAGRLSPTQVFSGKTDPVSVIQNGTTAQIEQCVRDCHAQTRGRCIVSAGCELTPGTSSQNMRAFQSAAAFPATPANSNLCWPATSA